MVEIEKVTPDVNRLVIILSELVANLGEKGFAYGSLIMGQEVTSALAQCNFPAESGFESDEIVSRCQECDTWESHAARWRLILDSVEKYLEPSAKSENSTASGEESEDAEDEANENNENNEDEDEEGDEEGGGKSGIVGKITDEFAKKKEVDSFLLVTLPKIPIVGLPFRFVYYVFNLLKKLWLSFLSLVDELFRLLDAENNILSAIRIVSRNKKFSWIIVGISTILAYSHFFWYGLIWPVLRWLTDPIGRSMRFFKKRSGKSTDQDQDDDDDPDLDP